MSEGIEDLLRVSLKGEDLLIDLITHSILLLHREGIGEVHQDLSIVGVGMCQVFVDVLSLLESMLSFVEFREDDVEFTMFLRERESLDDEGSCLGDLSSSDERSGCIGYFDEFVPFFRREGVYCSLILWMMSSSFDRIKYSRIL